MAYDNTGLATPQAKQQTSLVYALVRARELVKKHEHLKHNFFEDKHGAIRDKYDDDTVALCTMGALATGAGMSLGHGYLPYEGEALKLTRALGFDREWDLCAWNNRPETTKDDVVKRFDYAIEHLSAGDA